MEAHPEFFVVVGSGRSGTQYLASVLRRTLDIGFAAEPKIIVRTWNRIGSFGDLADDANLRRLAERVHGSKMFRHLRTHVGVETTPDTILNRLSERTYADMIRTSLRIVADARGCERMGWKDPEDCDNIPVLAELFPEARFVHIVRDGRDMALSMLKMDWGPTNTYALARYWKRCVETARRDGRALGPDRFFELRYEDLVVKPTATAHRLGAYLNGDSHPEQVDAFAALLEETSDPSRVDVWKRKMSADDQRIFEAVAGDTLDAFGYDRVVGAAARLSPVAAGYYRSSNFVRWLANGVVRRARRTLFPRPAIVPLTREIS